MNKKQIFALFFIIFVVIIINTEIVLAKTIWQIFGDWLERLTGKSLSKQAGKTVYEGAIAEDIAEQFIQGKLTKSVLISGGSGASKYSTTSFAKKFIPDFTHAPDYIYLSGKTVKIIEVKLSGTGKTEQIKAFDELAEAISKKGFNVERIIQCKTCKSVPKGWEGKIWKTLVPPDLETFGTAFAVISFLRTMKVLMFESEIQTCKDDSSYTERNSVFSNVLKELKYDNEFEREKLCEDVLYEIRDFKYNALLNRLLYGNLWDNSKEHRYQLCVDYKMHSSKYGMAWAEPTAIVIPDYFQSQAEENCKKLLGISEQETSKKCNTNADTNCDGKVDRDELGKYIDLWSQGKISRADLDKTIEAWQKELN